MRRTRLTTAVLLAGGLLACGSNDGEGKPGAGGGGGGGKDDPVPACGEVRVVALRGSGDELILDESAGSDDWEPACAPESTNGYDLIAHFRAPTAGAWRFSTAGTEYDTVVWAMRDCNDGFSVVACNDDFGQSKQSQILVDLQQGEEIFVGVELVGAHMSLPFRLTATRVAAEPPRIEELQAFHNRSVGTTGFRALGSSPDGEVVGVAIQVYSGEQALFRAPEQIQFAETTRFWLARGGSEPIVEGSFYLGDTAPQITAVELALLDENGQVGPFVKANTVAPPTVGRGAPCDDYLALSVCGPDDACVIRAPSTEYLCSSATPPTATTIVATKNIEAGYWGLVVEGSDPERDATYVRLLPRRENGSAAPIGETGRTLLDFHDVVWNGDSFRGVATVPAVFNGPCLPPARQVFADCMNGGGSEAACLETATANLVACYDRTLEEVISVDVEIVDVTGRATSIQNVAIGEAPSRALGELCDPWGATGACPADAICWSESEREPEVCREDEPVCPDDWNVIEITRSGNSWVYSGNNANGRTDYPTASCGGGGPADLIGFTAPEAGRYRFATSSLGANVDTLIAVRRFCQSRGYELGCNDDATSTDPASSVVVELGANERVYVLVDSYAGSATGPYTLTITRQ